MSYFNGLASDVLGVILVGAEGCAETDGQPWLRDATPEERCGFVAYCRELYKNTHGEAALASFNPRDWHVDGNNRPYWLKTVLNHPATPEIARQKAREFTRALRIHVAY